MELLCYVIMLITHPFVIDCLLKIKKQWSDFAVWSHMLDWVLLFFKTDLLLIKRDKAVIFKFRIISSVCMPVVLLHIEGIRCSPDTTCSREEVTPNLLFAFYQCHVSPRDLWISQRVGVIINQRNPFFTCDRTGRRRYSAIVNPLRGIVVRRRIGKILYLHNVSYIYVFMYVCVWYVCVC